MKAKLIICHHSNDFRALKEMEGSKSQYIAGSKESSKPVEVEKATLAEISWELSCIGIEVSKGLDKVAEQFKDEICSRPDGNLAWDEDTHEGFFKIIK